MQPILPYIMQNQPQIPDIENGIHVNMNAHEDLGKMHQRITKLENAVAKLNKFVDTSCSGACATFCAGVIRVGLDVLLIWVAVKVLS
jgi:hypothetical protein